MGARGGVGTHPAIRRLRAAEGAPLAGHRPGRPGRAGRPPAHAVAEPADQQPAARRRRRRRADVRAARSRAAAARSARAGRRTRHPRQTAHAGPGGRAGRDEGAQSCGHPRWCGQRQNVAGAGASKAARWQWATRRVDLLLAWTGRVPAADRGRPSANPLTSVSSSPWVSSGVPRRDGTTTPTTGSGDFPAQMVELATQLPDEQRFASVVVDEAQDFADTWWPALLTALRDDETGGVYAFTDAGQRVFARYGDPPVPLVPIVLDHNVRNTRQIADAFGPLAPMRMRLLGEEGPHVRFIECSATDAIGVGDDQVDVLLGHGWRPEHVALLTTGSRHPEQVTRQASGHASYWASCWDVEQVFYGHVLGFKGLERRAVVFVLNEAEPRERSRERLYVGLFRARDESVVVGDPYYVREVGGPEVAERLDLPT